MYVIRTLWIETQLRWIAACHVVRPTVRISHLSSIFKNVRSVAEDIDYSSQTPLSQVVRPQHFYYDLDRILENQLKDRYIFELIRLCKDDPECINDYRERLAERARQDQTCLRAKLLNRRNSPNATKSQKLAQDCYVLYVFTKGNSSRDIFDVFAHSASAAYDASANITVHNVNDSSQNAHTSTRDKTSTKLEIPDITTMLLNLQSDLAAMTNIVKHNNAMLIDIGNETRSLATNAKLILTSENGLLSKLGELSQYDQVYNEIKNIGTNIGRINKKIEDTSVNTEIKTNLIDNTGTRGNMEILLAKQDSSFADIVRNKPPKSNSSHETESTAPVTVTQTQKQQNTNKEKQASQFKVYTQEKEQTTDTTTDQCPVIHIKVHESVPNSRNKLNYRSEGKNRPIQGQRVKEVSNREPASESSSQLRKGELNPFTLEISTRT